MSQNNIYFDNLANIYQIILSKSGTCPKITKSPRPDCLPEVPPVYETVPQECLPELIETRGCMQKACPTWDAEVTCWMRQMG